MSGTSSATLTLPADPRSPARAREFVDSWLDAWGLPDVRNEAKLLTSELVTNAVLHAGTELTLTVSRDAQRQVVRVSVRDGSKAVPNERNYTMLATTGRGLRMINEGAQAFGVEPSDAGKAVWFELSLTGSERGRRKGPR